MALFPGFARTAIDIGEVAIHTVHGGQGPPVLLLHGFPQTHVMWHKIAPALAEHFTVVATDLRGYGDSGRPASGPDHAAYSKRGDGPRPGGGHAAPRLRAVRGRRP